MAASEHSEPQKNVEQALERLPLAIEAIAENAPPTTPENTAFESAAFADTSEIQHVQEQLRALSAKADVMDAEATRLQQESGGNASGEVEQARSQAQAMRGAAEQAQAAIAAAPTDARTGKKRISAARLGGISSLIEHIVAEADHETADLGVATSEARAHTASRTTPSRAAPRATTMVTRVNAAIHGRNAGADAHHGGASNNDDDENDPEFAPQMNRRDRRNHDGQVSAREAVGGVVGVVRAAGSRKKRATAQRVIGEISEASERDDRRGMLDGSLTLGRGVSRVTGSDDVGHVVTTTVGAVVTKSNTAGNLLGQGRVGDIGNAVVRNVDGALSNLGEWTGLSTVTNAMGIRSITQAQLQPFMAALNAGGWGHLVNARNEKQFDTDGNGRIDASEIMGVLRNNGVTFARLDADHDGVIERGELNAQLIAIGQKNHVHDDRTGGRPPRPTTPTRRPPNS